MALIDIEYGSLASSETMNKNFTYLDEKIAESNESIMTSISSILSNIATINTRLNDISEEVALTMQTLSAKIDDYKAKTKILVNKTSMVPNWSACEVISFPPNVEYTAVSNGFLLLKPSIYTSDLVVNGVAVNFKSLVNPDDHSMQLVAIPVFEGDVIVTTEPLGRAYFLPALEISVENF